MDQEKRQFRQMKRDIKQAGNRKRRHRLQRELTRNPEEAAYSDADVGRYRTADLNGNDHDATRRRKTDGEEE
jgi:hypothetical protein